MDIKCPSCGKSNAASPCQRCGCDLSQLCAIETASLFALASAAEHLRNGEAAEACEQAARAWGLRHNSEAAQLAFLASVAMEDFEAALRWRALQGREGEMPPAVA